MVYKNGEEYEKICYIKENKQMQSVGRILAQPYGNSKIKGTLK